MRKLKSGFTLAEVLITIAVIGVVAALTLPNVITGYQYKTIGVKLSKFAAATEASARAFVASNGAFKTTTVTTGSEPKDFGAESFLRVGQVDAFQTVNTPFTNKNQPLDTSTAGIYRLKDGTAVAIASGTATDDTNLPKTGTGEAAKGIVDTSIYGNASFTIVFDPNVNGLPDTAQKKYSFVVTSLGYVFPDNADACLKAISITDSNEINYVSKREEYTLSTGKCYVAKQS